MHVIDPINIDNTYLNTTSAVEYVSAWVSGTTYTVGMTVSYDTATVHRKYERRVAGAGTTAPNLDTANWLDVGPTNKWAMFDLSGSSQTLAFNNLAVAFTNLSGTYGLGLAGLVCSSVSVTVQVPGLNAQLEPIVIVTFSQSWAISSTSKRPAQLTLSELVVPAGGTVNILMTTNTGTPNAVLCGACVIGKSVFLGTTQPGATVGIVSYSRKVTDEFGVTQLLKRANSKRLSVRLMLNNAQLEEVYKTLSELDGRAAYWITAPGTGLSTLDIFGFSKDFSIDVQYWAESLCTLELESLI